MKNEQQNNQNQGKQNTNTGNQYNKDQQQSGMKPGSDQTGKTGSQSPQRGNISVDNEGRIGKAHDQWNNNNRNEQDQKNSSNKQMKSDKTVTEPEIDAPIYDPEKTDKKIPRMEEQTKSNK